MGWIIGLLTAVLIIDCLFLILLVLIQLPKKEAGMGTAFGGGATDALFGAGTGNALTKMTKYAAGIFFVLTLSLSILNAQHSRSRKNEFEKQLQKVGKEAGMTAPAAEAPGSTTIVPAAKPAPVPAATQPAAAPITPKPAPAPLSTQPAAVPITPKPAAVPPAAPTAK